MSKSDVKESIELLSTLIQNRCVNPPGNEMKSIKTIQSFLQERNIDCQVFESAANRGNLVAKILGTKNSPRLMFGPSHVDVVPVDNPDDWTIDPFSGTLKDGHIWGRGALDMLFIVVAQIQAFVQLKKEKFYPKGDLILLIVSDEEAGGIFGIDWMCQNHPELIRADYSVTEAGGITVSPGKILFMNGEKGVSWRRISFKGSPGHGSMPYGSDNAAIKVADAIKRISKYNPPITTEYLVNLVQGLGLGLFQRTMLTNKMLLPIILKRLKRSNLTMARLVHGLSRLTMSPNIVHAGEKVNVIPGKSYVDVDIRTLPNQDEEYVIGQLKKALGSLVNEATISKLSPEEGGFESYGNASSSRSEFIQFMVKAIQKEIPRANLVPFIAPGASDSRYMRDIGCQAYGFALFDPETPVDHLSKLSHGTDERISIKTLELSQKAYYNLAKITLE